MQPSIRLNINNPCSESWNQMTPNDQGRFCASCQKTVVDFSTMDDRELVEFFTQYQGSVCGRLTKDQLDRPLLTTPERKTRSWHYWHYLIAGLLFSSEASAQSNPAIIQTTQNPSNKPETNTLTGDTIMYNRKQQPDSIRGHVIDNQGRPVSFASIFYGPKQGVMADDNGYFSIAANKLTGHQTLSVSAIGYNSNTVSVEKVLTNNQIKLTMYENTLGEIVTVGGAVVKHRKKKKPIADTVSMFKDTLAAIGLTKPALTAYPNPINRGGSLTISTRLDQSGPYSLQLYSSSGALVTSRELNKTADNNNLSLPVPASLVPGIYFVKLSHPKLSKCYSQEIIVY